MHFIGLFLSLLLKMHGPKNKTKKKLTQYTYISLFMVSLYIIIFSYMFRPYVFHHKGETWLQETHMTSIYGSLKAILAQLKNFH